MSRSLGDQHLAPGQGERIDSRAVPVGCGAAPPAWRLVLAAC
jgi:hypothetical protein